MSREIKFRAWDTLMDASGDELCGPVMRQWGHVKRYMMDRLENDDTLQFMQFTGFQDVNGVDVYQDDICEHPSGERFIVVWDKVHSAFRASYSDYTSLMLSLQIDKTRGKAKVIGNIYENPELIEGDSNE